MLANLDEQLGLHAGVVGVEERSASHSFDADRVQLVHVHDLQLGALDRVLRREVGEQQVLTERRCGARRRHSGDATERVDDAFAVAREDRFVPAGGIPRLTGCGRVRDHRQRAELRHEFFFARGEVQARVTALVAA